MPKLKQFVFFSLITSLITSLFIAYLQAAPIDKFDRLFSSQNERKQLDLLRKNQQHKILNPQNSLASNPNKTIGALEWPEPITLQGYVRRSDGVANTLWINQQAVQENSILDNVQIGQLDQRTYSEKSTNSLSLTIKIPANGKQVSLKVGQTYDPETNEVRELQLVEKAKRLRLKESTEAW
jgi:hypothetical protein